MRPHEGGAGPASTGPTPATHPQASAKKSRGVSHSTPRTGVRPVPASRFLSWLTVFLVIFAVLTVHDHAVWAALAAIAAVVVGMVAELAP